MDLADRWQRVGTLLASALDIERERIGEEQCELVLDYLDHNELALAHDQIIDALDDLEMVPLDETRRILGEAGRLMDHRRSPIQKLIEHHETMLRAAILASDVDALDRLISPFALFINQAGRCITKDADLGAHRSGLKVRTFELVDEMIVRQLDEDTVIVNLIADLAGSLGKQAFGGRFAYTRIWRCDADRWRIEAAHCSAISVTAAHAVSN